MCVYKILLKNIFVIHIFDSRSIFVCIIVSAQFDSGSSAASGLLKLQVNRRNLLYVNSRKRERGRTEHLIIPILYEQK